VPEHATSAVPVQASEREKERERETDRQREREREREHSYHLFEQLRVVVSGNMIVRGEIASFR